MSLFISTTTPSDTFKESRLDKAITEVAVKLAKERSQGTLPQGPSLDVNFLIPSQTEKPAFSGMRMGNYDADHSTLYFERSVPMDLVESSKAEEFVKLVLEDVVTNAAYYFEELKVNFDLPSWKHTLTRISVSSIKNPLTSTLN